MELSNRKNVVLLLILGLFLVPAPGVVAAVLAPTHTPTGPGWGLIGRLVIVAIFASVGLCIVGWVVRSVPVSIALMEAVEIRYLLRRRAVPLTQVAAVSVEDRNVTLKSQGSLPMRARDTMLTLRFTDGGELSVSVPRASAEEFQARFRHLRS